MVSVSESREAFRCFVARFLVLSLLFVASSLYAVKISFLATSNMFAHLTFEVGFAAYIHCHQIIKSDFNIWIYIGNQVC